MVNLFNHAEKRQQYPKSDPELSDNDKAVARKMAKKLRDEPQPTTESLTEGFVPLYQVRSKAGQFVSKENLDNPDFVPSVPGVKLGSKQKTVRLTKYESATELCRALSPAIIEKVMRIIDTGKNEMAIVKAAELLLNRAYGKPFQPMAEMKEVVPPTINVTFPDSGKVFSTTITPEITTQLNNPKPSRSSETDIIREALTEDSDS